MKVRTRSQRMVLLAALPAAISLVTAAANVQAAPEVYGKLNVSLQKNDANTDATGDTLDNWTLESNASRVGVKGSADLDGGLKGLYKLEYGTKIDDGDGGAGWTSRNSYIGVQGDFGTVIGGKFDTPTKEAQGKIDQFNDYLLGDITNVIVGENRASNIAMYTSPKMGGIAVNVAIIPGENNGVAAGAHNNGPSDGASASVVYDTDSLYLALAVDNHVASDWTTSFMGVTTTPAVVETDIVRLAAQFKVTSDIALGAIVQHAEDSSSGGTEEQNGVILSGAFTMGKETLKAQYGHSEYDVSDTEIDSLSIGLDHSLSKDAKAYAYVTDIETTDISANNDGSQTTFGIGFEQKF